MGFVKKEIQLGEINIKEIYQFLLNEVFIDVKIFIDEANQFHEKNN